MSCTGFWNLFRRLKLWFGTTATYAQWVYSPLTHLTAPLTRLEPAPTPPRTTRAAWHSPVTTPTATAQLRNPTFYPQEQHGDARDNGGTGKETEGLEPPRHPHSLVHSVAL